MTKKQEPIALVGRACRFAGQSTSPSQLWSLLKDPRDVSSEIPHERFDTDAFYHEDHGHAGTSNVRRAYTIDQDIKAFDAPFFSIKATEAHAMDPQHRLLLETVYESLESAGASLDSTRGTDTAVYVGLMSTDYANMLAADPTDFPQYFATGTASSMASSRISYFFDWHGPSLTIDTACSSSLIAIHHAVQALRRGECSMAVVGGSNLILSPAPFVAESKLQMLSPTGKGRMWSANADGYARGDGVAAVCLKTLSAALKDGNHIYTVIRETGVNHDGHTKGITQPSIDAQAALIHQTYAKAGLDLENPADWPQYFEAHGTGTLAGDSVEASAVHRAFFDKRRAASQRLAMGSVKTVIGHTEGAAGLAGLLKASLAIENRTLVPNLLFDEPNPAVAPFLNDLELITSQRPWPVCSIPRASVNSFGFGGANAHAILEAYSDGNNRDSAVTLRASPMPVLFSASTEWSLRHQLERVLERLGEKPEMDFDALRTFLTSARSGLRERLALAAEGPEDLERQIAEALSSSGKLSRTAPTRSLHEPRVLGVFTGQGAQWARMACEMITVFPWAQKKVKQLQASLDSLDASRRPQWRLLAELEKSDRDSRITEPLISQTLCTLVQLVLLELLKLCGVKFDTVVGHSSGEIAAACAAGYLTDMDAIRIAYYRGIASTNVAGKDGRPGAMMAVGCQEDFAQAIIRKGGFVDRVCVAAINSADSVTISGDVDAVEQLKDILHEHGKFARLLKTDRAYHSQHVEAAEVQYLQLLHNAKIMPTQPDTSCPRWMSSVHARPIHAHIDDIGAGYWVENMSKPVLFRPALLAAVQGRTFDVAIEVGPHPALKTPAIANLSELVQDDVEYVAPLRRGLDSLQSLRLFLATMWQAAHLDLAKAHSRLEPAAQATFGTRPEMPAYAWDHRTKYWHVPPRSTCLALGLDRPNVLLGIPKSPNTSLNYTWRNRVRVKDAPWIQGHRIQNQLVMPAAGYICIAVEAALTVFASMTTKSVELLDLEIGQAIVVEDGDASFSYTSTVSLLESTDNEATCSFALHSESHCNAQCRVRLVFCQSDVIGSVLGQSRDGILEVAPESFYDSLARLGYGYEGPYRSLTKLQRRRDFATAQIPGHAMVLPQSRASVHPALLDGALQLVLLALSWPGDTALRQLWLPTGFQRIVFALDAASSAGVFNLAASSTVLENGTVSGNADLMRSPEELAIVIQGLKARPVQPRTAENDLQIFSRVEWGPLQPTWPKSTQGSMFDLSTQSTLSDLERIAFFFLRKLSLEFAPAARGSLEWLALRFLAYADNVVARYAAGKNPYSQPAWTSDTRQTIEGLIKKHETTVDAQFLKRVGDAFPSVLRGQRTMLEVLAEGKLLTRFYREGLAMQDFLEAMSTVVAQICFRFPHANIIEIGAGTGGATKSILKRIDGRFDTYTFTDISSGFFAAAAEDFEAHKSDMIFKTFDLEQDATAQNFEVHTFDIVIASLVVHATKDIRRSLQKARSLLKPGGYLVMLEITNLDQVRFGLLFGGLEGWWLGSSEERRFSPCVDIASWDAALKDSGFSGVDLDVSDDPKVPVPLSVICSRAVNSDVSELDNGTPAYVLDLIGSGSDSEPSELAKKLYDVSPTFVDARATSDVKGKGDAVLLVIEHRDGLQTLTAEGLSCLQRFADSCAGLLWISLHAAGHIATPKMSAGLCRVVASEMRHLRVKHVSVDHEPSSWLSCVLDEFTRFATEAKTGNPSEPEVRMTKSGHLIPRLVLDETCNSRHNSNSREICSRSSRNQTLSHLDGCIALIEGADIRVDDTGYLDAVELLLSVRCLTGCEPGYVFAGQALGQYYIGVSNRPSKVMAVESSRIVPVSKRNALDVAWLSRIAQMMSFYSVKRQTQPGDFVLLVDAAPSIINAVESLLGSTVQQLSVHEPLPFQTPEKNSTLCGACAWSTANYVVEAVQQANSVVLCSADPERRRAIQALKGCSTRLHCQYDLFDQVCGIHELNDCVRLASNPARRASDVEVVGLDNVIGLHTSDLAAWAMVDWRLPCTGTVRLIRASSSLAFDSKGAYWLVGLTGSLGRSLASWMAERGAKSIVLSSRKPRVPLEWQSMMRHRGCKLCIIACDVTDEDSVKQTHSRILQEYGRLRGVVQGAMVLKDAIFVNQTIEDFRSITMPKVQGSMILDKLLRGTDLDFTVYLSSMASIIGNAGQAAYASANNFMTELAQARKDTGERASAVSIGAIVGNGYVSRELATSKQANLERTGNVLMSEHDFLEIFAEGVLLARDSSRLNAVLTTGLRVEASDAARDFSWFENPMFQHLIPKQRHQEVVEQRKASRPVREMLEECSNPDEVSAVVRDAFLGKLSTALHSEITNSLLQASADEIGLDSLIAVDLRSWIQASFSVDVPVLKLLTASRMQALVDLVTEELLSVTGDSVTSASVAGAPVTTVVDSPPESNTAPAEDAAPIRRKKVLPAKLYSGTSGQAHISKRKQLRVFKSSFQQDALWVAQQACKSKTSFNISTMTRIEGSVDTKRFSEAIAQVFEAHEILKTAVRRSDDGRRLVQVVDPNKVLPFRILGDATEEEARRLFCSYRSHVYDISQGDTWQADLVRTGKNTSIFLLGYHHIVMDGFGFEVFVGSLYAAYASGKMALSSQQYGDYANRQRSKHSLNLWAAEMAFWAAKIASIPRYELPVLGVGGQRRERSLEYQARSTRTELHIPAETVRLIRQRATEARVQPHVFYLAAFGVFVASKTGVHQTCVGMVDPGRPDAELLNSLGCFLNTYPVLVSLEHGSFSDLLVALREEVKTCFAHSSIPFEAVLQDLKLPQRAGQHPLFQLLFNYRKDFKRFRDLGSWAVQAMEYDLGQTSFDLALDIMDDSGSDVEVVAALHTQNSLYSSEDGSALLAQFLSRLESLSQDVSYRIDVRLSQSVPDVDASLSSKVGSGCLTSLAQHVHSMSLTHPNNDAIVFEEKTVSYTELMTRASCIAQELQYVLYTAQSRRVCVAQDPGLDFYSSVLAIWALGASYVPVDPNVSAHHIEDIVSSSSLACVLIDGEASVDDFKALRCVRVDMIPHSSAFVKPVEVDMASEAMVLFTSGSTGRRKGVRLSYQGIASNVSCSVRYWDINDTDRIFQQSSAAFDMHASQMAIAFTTGAALVCAPKTARHDPKRLTDLIAASRVTVTEATPSEYSAWLRFGSRAVLQQSAVRTAISGGEHVTSALRHAFRDLGKRNLRLIDCYGPTEISFCCASAEVPYWDDSNVPLEVWPSYGIAVVDKELKQLPQGQEGEVCIRGPCVALGYLGSDSLQIRDDTLDSAQPGWARMHLSGDLGVVNEQGCLKLRGRRASDTQVKINGIRTDLNEISELMVRRSQGRIAQAAVIVAAEPGTLAAFVCLSHGSDAALKVVQDLNLPTHMRPARAIAISRLPLNSSGKLDRKALEKLATDRGEPQLLAHEFEDVLRRHWHDLLDVSDFNVDSDFFALGGTSLFIPDLQARIKDETGIEPQIADLFRCSTLGSMADLLSGQARAAVGKPGRHVELQEHSSVEIGRRRREDARMTTDWIGESTPGTGAPRFCPRALEPKKAVLLTGATGLIGRAILKRLVLDDSIRAVHCIAVRRNISALRTDWPFNARKVRCFSGHLTDKNLGLDEATCRAVFANADVLVHAAAEVSFLKTYAVLRPVNVEPLAGLVKLCLEHSVSMHYISSASVARLSGKSSWGERSLSNYLPAEDTDGYTAAKWVCERLLEQSSAQSGLPVIVHRPSIVVGGDAEPADITGNVLKYSKLIGATPIIHSWRGMLDFVSVQAVARDLVDALKRPITETYQICLESGEMEFPLASLNAELKRRHSRSFVELSIDDWTRAAQRAGMPTLIAEYLREASRHPMVLPRLMKDGAMGL